MEMIAIVLRQILVMFIYLLIGYLLFKKKLISQEGSRSMASLLLYVVLPCVIVRSFCVEYTPQRAIELLVSLAAAAVVLLVCMVFSALLFRKEPIDQFGVAFSNAGFMGFPLVTAILGADAVFYAAGFVALLNIFQWTYGQNILAKSRQKGSVAAIVKNPLVIALLVGMVIFFAQIPVPQLVATPMTAIAGMNAPLAMIVLGIYLAQTDLKAIFTKAHLYWVCAARLLVLPLLTVLLLRLLPSRYEALAMTLVIVNAAPIGSNVAVYAQKLDQDYPYAVQTVCLSTLLSILSMPLVITLGECLLK